MEAKEAYQQLLDEKEGRSRSSSAGSGSGGSYGAGRRTGSASAGSSSGWGYRGSGAGSGAGGYGRPSDQQPRWQPAEEAYSFGKPPPRAGFCSSECCSKLLGRFWLAPWLSLPSLPAAMSCASPCKAAEVKMNRALMTISCCLFFSLAGDMLRDLDKELSAFARERQQKRAASGGAPKSLWEELYDIGEEFVDFLEQVGSCWRVHMWFWRMCKSCGELGTHSVDCLDQVRRKGWDCRCDAARAAPVDIVVGALWC